MTKVKTYVTSRFNKVVTFSFGKLEFDKEGFAESEIPEGLDLEKYRLYSSDHKEEKIEEIKSESPKKPSAEEASIELQKRKEAKKVKEIQETQETGKVEEIQKTGKVEETQETGKVEETQETEKKTEEEFKGDVLKELKMELDKSKLPELKKMAEDMKLPIEEWKNFKKSQMIDYLAPKI